MAQGPITEQTELIDEDGGFLDVEDNILEVEDTALRRFLVMIWTELRRYNDNG